MKWLLLLLGAAVGGGIGSVGAAAVREAAEERRMAREDAEEQQVCAHANAYVSGVMAAMNASHPHALPRDIPMLQEALEQAGVAKGRVVSTMLRKGRPPLLAVLESAELEWSARAECPVLSYETQAKQA